MQAFFQRLRRVPPWLAGLPSPALFVVFFFAVALSHWTLLHLPYFWDEGGYYIPAALDFYHRFALIPEFTNAHPPLPNVALGTLWHITGYSILPTRLLICGFAAASLLAVFRLASSLLGAAAGLFVAMLTALYPIWFAQSTLAHADIFAAAFTLWAFAFYFPVLSSADTAHTGRTGPSVETVRHQVWIAILFSLAALSKETAIVEPMALAAIHLALVFRRWHNPPLRREQVVWLATLAFPALPLGAWFAYHRLRTGFTFGNPEYLRYNATANFTIGHVLSALRYRGIHLFWQRDIWVSILLALACLLFLPVKSGRRSPLPPPVLRTVGVLVIANWLAFSVLGGALLTRYLLPVYPLILLVCVGTWKAHTRAWPALAALTAAAFLPALWWNPPVAFAPEDNLTYRDMIVVHQEAIAFIDQHFPGAQVLTSWPAAGELSRPSLGYTDRPIRVTELDNFSATEIEKAAQEPGSFDTALIFSKVFYPPAMARYLLAHPDSNRARDFNQHRDLLPGEVALKLGGTVVFRDERNGEWAAVLRFPRSYDARLSFPRVTTTP